MAKEFTKEPIPYVSNRTYLWRFLQGSVCGIIFGLGIGNLAYGIGLAVGIGIIFAFRPTHKNHAQIGILTLSMGVFSGIGRLFDMLIPGFIVGIIAGYIIYYYWKQKIQKTNTENMPTQ